MDVIKHTPKMYETRKVTMQVTTAFSLFICFVLIIVDQAVFRTTLFDIHSFTPDGAYFQYLHVKNTVDSGYLWEEASDSPIFLTHILRYAIYYPFIILSESALQLDYIFLVILGFPVINYYYEKVTYLPLFLPLVAAYFISFRAVLTAISIGYVVIYLFSNRSYPYLLAGLFLSLLSSAVSTQIVLLMGMYTIFRERHFLLQLRVMLPFILFCVILALALSEKIEGFIAGGSGYAAATAAAQSNILLTILSRSTIYFDIVNGNIRGYAYALIGSILLLVTLKSFLLRDPAAKDHRLIILAISPGFLLEGLGVMSVMMVFVWSLLKVDLSKRRR